MATVQNSGCGNSKSNSDPPASAHIKRRSCKVKVAVLRPPIPGPLYYLSTHVNLNGVLWPPWTSCHGGPLDRPEIPAVSST